jgi:hypothetical protein
MVAKTWAGVLQDFFLFKSWNHVSDKRGLTLLNDDVHLNERSAAILLGLLGEFVSQINEEVMVAKGSRNGEWSGGHHGLNDILSACLCNDIVYMYVSDTDELLALCTFVIGPTRVWCSHAKQSWGRPPQASSRVLLWI